MTLVSLVIHTLADGLLLRKHEGNRLNREGMTPPQVTIHMVRFHPYFTLLHLDPRLSNHPVLIEIPDHHPFINHSWLLRLQQTVFLTHALLQDSEPGHLSNSTKITRAISPINRVSMYN